MGENEGQDLATDMKKEMLDTIRNLQNEKRSERQNDNINIKFFEDCELKIGKNNLKVSIAEITEKILEENKEEKTIVTYDIYMKYKGQNVLIANINENGELTINEEMVKQIDPENKLGLLGLKGQEKSDLEILKKLEGKTEQELEEELGEREEEKDTETIKDDNESKEDEQKEDEEKEDVGNKEAEAEVKILSNKIGVSSKDACKIRRDSQFYKNYPHIPKTAFFYLDKNNEMHAKYMDENGQIQDLEGFNEVQDKTPITSLGNEGEPIQKENPYRVMDAQGLEIENVNAQDVRVAMYKDTYGDLRIETVQQGRNGEWEGVNIEQPGKERNSAEINEMTDERMHNPQVGEIAERREELENSGYAEDGLQIDELSKERKIEEYINDGYTKEEANKIYDYIVGKEKMTEDKAKKTVLEESKEDDDGHQRTPGGDAWNRLFGE